MKFQLSHVRFYKVMVHYLQREKSGELKPHIHKFETKTHFNGSKLEPGCCLRIKQELVKNSDSWAIPQIHAIRISGVGDPGIGMC